MPKLCLQNAVQKPESVGDPSNGKGCHGDLEVWRRSGTDLCDCMAANVKNQSVCHLEWLECWFVFTVTMETKVWKVRYRNADDFGGRVSAEGFYCLIGPLGLEVDVWWSIKHVDNPPWDKVDRNMPSFQFLF